MNDQIKVVMTLTHAAEVAGRARGDLDGLRRAAEAAVEEIYDTVGEDDGPDDVMDIFFHVFSWNGEHNFILVPAKDRSCMIVDVCVMREMPAPEGFKNLPEDHPMKGKKMMMPEPFSAGDEDEIPTREMGDE